MKARHDYLPFGEEIAVPYGGRTTLQGYAPDNVRQKFTGKQRDTETGLDYFGARYYSSPMGRFTSADSFAGDGANPQTLNLYAYALNNPLAYVDPTGHAPAPLLLIDYYDDLLQEELHNTDMPTTPSELNPQYFQNLENPVPEATSRIDQASAQKAPVIYIYFAGITKGSVEAANANAKQIADWQGVPEYQVIGVTNNHDTVALSGIPNQKAADYGKQIIEYALSKGFKPEQIVFVSTSNGVPTLDLTLLKMSKVTFGHAILMAPNTSDIAVLRGIVKRTRTSVIAMSDNDEALHLGIKRIFTGGVNPAHLSVKDIQDGLKKFTKKGKARVIGTDNVKHFLPDYINELKSKCGTCLK